MPRDTYHARVNLETIIQSYTILLTFLQSSVCLKQLAFDILELLLTSAFPELDDIFKQLHEEKHKFGEFRTQ